MPLQATAGPVIKRNKSASKKVLISIIAPIGTSFTTAGTTVKEVRRAGSTETWDKVKVSTASSDNVITLQLTGKKVTASPKAKAKVFLDPPPEPGTLTITLLNPPPDVGTTIDIPVVFVDDAP